MKRLHAITLCLALAGLAVAPGANLLQAATAEAKVDGGRAEVRLVVGSVSYSENGKSGILRPGMVLGEGATITTGPQSGAELWLGDNGQNLRIIENTTVEIEQLRLQKKDAQPVATTSLTLKQGGLVGSVKKLSAGSDYKVKYANGVAGIRGTDWAILPGLGVVCFDGQVSVTFVINGVAQEAVTIGKGQVAQLEGGKVVVKDAPPGTKAPTLMNQGQGGLPSNNGRDVQVFVTPVR